MFLGISIFWFSREGLRRAGQCAPSTQEYPGIPWEWNFCVNTQPKGATG